MGVTSCSDFLDTVPHDALSPSTTWKTEDDAQKFLVGCYDGWADRRNLYIWIVVRISAITISNGRSGKRLEMVV